MTGHTGPAWQKLSEELDLWAKAGKQATLWWRDDDATEPSGQLDHLLALTGDAGVPLSLAVIPATATQALAQHLADQKSHVNVLVHGLAHQNNAPVDDKKAEFHAARPLPEMTADLSDALSRLKSLMPVHFLPVLVPPWNRLPPVLVPALSSIGFHGLSTYKSRTTKTEPPGLVINNCHVDLINWRENRRFVGEEQVLTLIHAHLAARRNNIVDSEEITGILSHHLVHDGETRAFLHKFLAWTTDQPTVRWLDAREVFKLP